jgi:hypothetical protein
VWRTVQRGELFDPTHEEWIGSNHEPARSQFDQLCEDLIEVTFGAGIQDLDLKPERAGPPRADKNYREFERPPQPAALCLHQAPPRRSARG